MPSESIFGRPSAAHDRQLVYKLVRFTDVDWVTIPAREEKKEKTEFWDAVERAGRRRSWSRTFSAMPSIIFFCEGTDSIEIQGRWQRDLLDEKILREKKEEEEEDSFSQDSRASTARLQDIEEEEFFFDASDTIDEEEEKNDDDDVFWDASDKKSKEWQEIVRMGYRQLIHPQGADLPGTCPEYLAVWVRVLGTLCSPPPQTDFIPQQVCPTHVPCDSCSHTRTPHQDKLT